MNHFFGNITWFSYFELLAFVLMAYYLYVALRWYRADIARLFRGRRSPAEGINRRSPPPMAEDECNPAGVYVQTEQRLESPPEAEI